MKNVTLWVVVVIVFLLFTPAVIWIDRQSMFEITDGLAVGAGAVALYRWGPAAWRAMKPPIHDLFAADYLVVGLGLICTGAAARFAGQWFWRANDKPNWFIDSAGLLYFTIAIVIGLYLLMVPTFAEAGGHLSVGAWPKTVALFGSALALSALLILAGWG